MRIRISESIAGELHNGRESGRKNREEKIVCKLKDEYLRENKALQAIEALYMMLGDGVDVRSATKKELDEFAVAVYELSHSAQRGICFDSHEDWRKKADEILRVADKEGIAGYKNPLEKMNNRVGKAP